MPNELPDDIRFKKWLVSRHTHEFLADALTQLSAHYKLPAFAAFYSLTRINPTVVPPPFITSMVAIREMDFSKNLDDRTTLYDAYERGKHANQRTRVSGGDISTTVEVATVIDPQKTHLRRNLEAALGLGLLWKLHLIDTATALERVTILDKRLTELFRELLSAHVQVEKPE